jgi:hypothetical protein
MTSLTERKLDVSSFKEISQEGGTKVLSQISEGLPHGLGIAFKPNKESYKGYWKKGVFDGLGILSIGDEHSFCGNFENGKSIGFGLLRKGKDLIFGEFDFDSLTGSGSYSKPNMEYRGYFRNGAIEGFGKFSDKQAAAEYIGFFSKGMYSKEGRLTTPAEKFTGVFANGKKTGAGHQKKVKEGEEYWGYWSNDRREAFGRLLSPDGRIYVGEWKSDKENGICFVEHKEKGYTYLGEMNSGLRSGLGKLEFKNYTYIGKWKENKKHGLGIQSMNDGSIYFGTWVDNLKEGIGKETGPSINYQGEWKAGQPHGRGILVTEKDTVVYVKFEEGKIVKALLPKEVENIEKELACLNYEAFRAENENKLQEHQKQIDSSAKQLEEKLKKIGPTIDTEYSKYCKLMTEIEQKADQKVKAAKELEKLIDWVCVEHAKLTSKKFIPPEKSPPKKVENPPIMKNEPDLLKIENSTKKVHDRSQERKSLLVTPKDSPDKSNEEIKPSKGISDQKEAKNLEDQAERLAAYEAWLIKETQKLKENQAKKKVHKVNTEYSTKAMMEAEKEKVRKIFAKEFEKLTKDLEESKHEVARLKAVNEYIDATNKKVEAYSNDVDQRNFKLKSELEDLFKESRAKYQEYDEIISDLRSQIAALKKDLAIKCETIKNQEGKIDDLSVTNSHLSSVLQAEQTKSADLQLKYIRAVVEIHAIRISCEVYNEEIKVNLKTIEELKQKNSKQSCEMEEIRKSMGELKDLHEKDLADQQVKHQVKLDDLDKERKEIAENHEQEIARLKRQIRILETGGEVDDTEEKLRVKELEENRQKMKEMRDEVKKLKNTIEANELEIGNLKKMVADRDRALKDSGQRANDLELHVNQLEETVREFNLKQKEWTDMKEALANNIKALKDREQELKSEIQSKKVMEREELNKRNEKLSKNFFDDTIKPKVLMTLGKFI